MIRKTNSGNLAAKKTGPVWTVKVGVFVPVFHQSKILKLETKLWKIKEILN